MTNGQDVAVPTGIDTGTMYADVPVCARCNRAIEKVRSKPANPELAGKTWIHSHNKSIFCFGRGDR